jgi:hypothetical protein
MNSYEERIERRRERLLDRADASKAQGHALINQAERLASVIPFGQPILVGHHSEGRDRRYRGRISGTFRKGFALTSQAQELTRKAAAVGTGGVSSDDPDAIEKLTAQLKDCKAAQERMRAANSLVRHNDRPGLANMGFSDAEIERLFTPVFGSRLGFAPYELDNNNKEIRRLERRITELQLNAQRKDKEEHGNGYIYREDTTEHRVMFLFPHKPAENVRAILRQYGFKFSPSRNSAWVRLLCANGVWAAKIVREKLDAIQEAQ